MPVLGDLGLRLGLFDLLRRNGLKAITAIEPSVVAASDLKVGEGSLISCGTILLNHVEIEPYAFIGSGVKILHDVRIGRNCVVGGGAVIGSTATIGENFACGVGSVVRSGGIRIGNNAQLAAGAVVLKDVPDNAFVIGNPGRIVRYQDPVEVREP